MATLRDSVQRETRFPAISRKEEFMEKLRIGIIANTDTDSDRLGLKREELISLSVMTRGGNVGLHWWLSG